MTNMIEKKSQCDQDTMRDMSMAHDNRKNDKKNYVKALHSLCEENIEKIVQINSILTEICGDFAEKSQEIDRNASNVNNAFFNASLINDNNAQEELRVKDQSSYGSVLANSNKGSPISVSKR